MYHERYNKKDKHQKRTKHKNIKCKYHANKRKFSAGKHEAQIEYLQEPSKKYISQRPRINHKDDSGKYLEIRKRRHITHA
jgi:ribosomal protein S18